MMGSVFVCFDISKCSFDKVIFIILMRKNIYI